MITAPWQLPAVIQGGMGVAISSWRLANTVARHGQLGVISGTAIERVIAARLQEGDPGGHLHRACNAFPDQALVQRVFERWHRPDGLPAPGRYRPVPMFNIAASRQLLELTVLAAFAEVWLAKEGHDGRVGINLLEKLQAPTLPVLYGAVLAGVDDVLMGAGIPREIPAHLDRLCAHEPTVLRLALDGGDSEPLPFDPGIVSHHLPTLRRPRFIAIISSHVLATSLQRSGGVDGFVVESEAAGGHNAPPRGWSAESGADLCYGPRDVPDLERIAACGLPFWLAGGQARPDALEAARAVGATGIQIGTAFAFCAESGMDAELRRGALQAAVSGRARVRTEGRASPTGFPFKVLEHAGTEGGRPADQRTREPCRLGYLRRPFRRADGAIAWRCAAEPEHSFVDKGGKAEECAGRRCICHGLMATAGHPHERRDGELELPLITSGAIDELAELVDSHGPDYDAHSVLERLLNT